MHLEFVNMQLTDYDGARKAYGRAIELYSTAIKFDPALTAAHYRIARRYLESGRTSLAEIHLERFRDLKAAEQTP